MCIDFVSPGSPGFLKKKKKKTAKSKTGDLSALDTRDSCVCGETYGTIYVGISQGYCLKVVFKSPFQKSAEEGRDGWAILCADLRRSAGSIPRLHTPWYPTKLCVDVRCKMDESKIFGCGAYEHTQHVVISIISTRSWALARPPLIVSESRVW